MPDSLQRLQYRIGRIYVSEVVLWCNAVFASAAFLSTTILHEQSRNGLSFSIYPDIDPLDQFHARVTDAESLGCQLFGFYNLCSNATPMRVALIIEFLVAILVALAASTYLRQEERREAERRAGLRDDYLGDVDVDVEMAPPRTKNHDRSSNMTMPPTYTP